jgi:hypothetical protein
MLLPTGTVLAVHVGSIVPEMCTPSFFFSNYCDNNLKIEGVIRNVMSHI